MEDLVARIHEAIRLSQAGEWETADRLLKELDQYPDRYGEHLLMIAYHLERAGDAIRAENRPHSDWYYHQALSRLQNYASGATSGAEGCARMLAVNDLREKMGR